MRKKSLYFKVFTLIMAIFLLCFILIGTLIFGFLGNYFNEKNEERLKEVAKEVSGVSLSLVEVDGKGANHNSKELMKIRAEAFEKSVQSIAESTDTEIFVVDTESNVVISSVEDYNGAIKPEFTDGVLKGNGETFHGEVNKTKMLAVTEPILYGDKVVGGVVVCIPVPEISQMRSEILGIVIKILVIVAILTAILAYFLSQRITKPIYKLSNAAKSIANGNFKERVEVDEIEELGELGETFNEMAESIEQFEYTRNSFLANVSHDLRTPMTTITGFVQGILDGTIPDEKREWYLSIVLDESKRLSRIVTDLLDISKLEQGSFNLEMRNFDINELVRLTVIKFEKKITDKNIRLSVEFEGEGLYVTADKDAISRVLTNLLDNAIKFTDEGGIIHIRVGTKNSKAYVSVQNSGHGIAEEELLHIFDRFYKTDKSRSLDKNGAGLGLYIVKSIMQAHGERVWAESKQGEFARFSFTMQTVENKKQIEG